MKERKFKILSVISFLCFLIGILMFDDASFVFIGLGIVFLAFVLRIIIMDCIIKK